MTSITVTISYVRLQCWIGKLSFTKKVVGLGTPNVVEQGFREAHPEVETTIIIEADTLPAGANHMIVD
jgi:hypothetical protein